jgi:RNA polymerase sigma factor (sigma-70 family)
MTPSAAEPLSPGIFLGPALRAQPDRRLVRLVREGYEVAFEEIVRRYRKPLDRFAAAIVGGRSEDVTQDAFSKALLALRGSETDIELKPWLYRIVRNTALNALRDGPPPTEQLGETIPGGVSAAVEAERREETAELMRRLRALPEPQRAAIVMRELEGLSHEEIATALGVSGGAARQAIHRGRTALRNGFGVLIPLPLLRMLFDHGAEAAGAGAGGAVGAASATGGGGAVLGGLGATGALKVGLATAVLAGSVGAGVAVQHDRGERGPEPAEAAVTQLASSDNSTVANSADSSGPREPSRSGEDRGGSESGPGDDGRRHGDDGSHRGHGDGGPGDSSRSSGPSHGSSSGHGGHGSGHGGRSGDDDFGEDTSGGSHSGHHGRGGESGSSGSGGSGPSGGQGSSGSGDDGSAESHSGSGSGLSGGSGHGGSGQDSGSSGGSAPVASPLPAPEPAPVEPVDGSRDSGSGGGRSGSGNDGSGGG